MSEALRKPTAVMLTSRGDTRLCGACLRVCAGACVCGAVTLDLMVGDEPTASKSYALLLAQLTAAAHPALRARSLLTAGREAFGVSTQSIAGQIELWWVNPPKEPTWAFPMSCLPASEGAQRVVRGSRVRRVEADGDDPTQRKVVDFINGNFTATAWARVVGERADDTDADVRRLLASKFGAAL